MPNLELIFNETTRNRNKKIVILRALQLGDMLCAIPAIRALRHAYPDAHIILVGLPWAKLLLQKFPNYFDAVIEFPGYPGLPEQEADVQAFPSFLNRIQNEQFDLAIQLQGNGGVSNPLVKLFNAKRAAGFYKKGRYCPDAALYIEYPNVGYEVERHLKLMDHLGIVPMGKHLEFLLTKEEDDELQKLALPIEPQNYVCIHPGSRGAERRWAPEYFAALGDYCISQGLPVVITGTKDELEIVNSVVGFMKEQPIIAAGKTSLGAVGVLIKNAFALIANCTGVAHISSALNTKSVVISLNGEPNRWASLDKEIHKTIDWITTPDYELVLNETKELINSRR